MEVWRDLFALRFLKNQHGKVGQVRIILLLYSIAFFSKIIKDGLGEIGMNWIYLWIVMFTFQLGEKGYKYLIEAIKAWKDKGNAGN